MLNKTLTSALAGSALALGLVFAGSASAGTVSCVSVDTGPYGIYDIRNKVDPNIGCEILEPIDANNNDQLNPPVSGANVAVNDIGFFGIKNWLFDGKWDELETGPTNNSSFFNFTGGQQSGTFTYVGALNILLTDVMFVFKDGANTNLVAYLIDMPVLTAQTDQTGTYFSPFVDPPFPTGNTQTAKDISHISVYYRAEGDDDPQNGVPEPATLGLLGLGMLAMGALRRRKVALKR